MNQILWALPLMFIATALSSPATNFTFSGGAFLNGNSIVLTQETYCAPVAAPPPLSGVGRAFSVSPVRFLDLSTNATASFSSTFSFTITRLNSSCMLGNGFVFQITSNTGLFSVSDGYMGLPDDLVAPIEAQDSYFAVEFDTSFEPNLENINGNHIGIDVNNIMSLASVDVLTKGIDLKNGKEMTAWIEYRDSEKVIKVWLGYLNQVKPTDPVLVTQVDLSKQVKEFMFVGFSASNGRGSSTQIVDRWRFRTFFRSLPSTMPMDLVEDGNCENCNQSDTIIQNSTLEFNKGLLVFSHVFGALAVVTIIVAAVAIFFLCYLRRLRLAHSEWTPTMTLPVLPSPRSMESPTCEHPTCATRDS